MIKRIAFFALAIPVLTGIGAGSALAQSFCSSLSAITLISSTTSTVSPAYDPFSGSDLTDDFSFTVNNGNASACSVAVVFARPTTPGQMSNGTQSLSFGLERTNGTNVLNTGFNFIDFYSGTLGGSSSGSGVVRVRIPGSQTTASAGNYTDTQVTMYLFGWRGSSYQFARSYALTYNATIDQTCSMSPPSPSALNFTSAISLGQPNPSLVLTSTLNNINCTAPARVTLSGGAMQRTPSIGAVSGFDNFINWQATATFGSASVSLVTTSSTTQTSLTTNVPVGTTVGGVFSVDVNLLSGQRLQSGSYTSVLTVTVDPTL